CPARETKIIRHVFNPHRPGVGHHLAEEVRFDREHICFSGSPKGVKPLVMRPIPYLRRDQLLLAARDDAGMPERPTGKFTYAVDGELRGLGNGGRLVSRG